GERIKRDLLEHDWLYSDFTLEMSKAGDYRLRKHGSISEDWRVTFADTGLDTNTGGRVKRIEQYLGDDETFCVTYGDGLANVDLPALLEFHHSHGRIATLTAVHPRSNFGLLKLDDRGAGTEFEEKPAIPHSFNSPFFFFHPTTFPYSSQ